MEEENFLQTDDLVVYDPEPEVIESSSQDASALSGEVEKEDSSSKFSHEKSLQLISIIEKYPSLWDKRLIDYRNATVAENTWRMVASQIELDVPACKDQWLRLRRHYRLVQRRGRASTLPPKGKPKFMMKEPSQPKWYAYEAMAFLDDANYCDDDINAANTSKERSWQDEFAHSLSNRNTLELISLVKTKPLLWNKTHPESGNPKKINEAWRWVAARMNLDVAVCKDKWNKLRITYYSHRKKVFESQNGTGSGQPYQPPWFEYKAMSFLREMVDFTLGQRESVENNFSEPNEHILEFIAVVRSHPSLWDRKHPHYKSVEMLDATWQLVADKMDLDVEDCKTKWYHLRGHFRRIRRKMLESEPGQTYQPTWYAYDAMTFLVEQIQHDKDKEKRSSSPKKTVPTKSPDKDKEKRSSSPKPRKSSALQVHKTNDGFFLDSFDILNEDGDCSDGEEGPLKLSYESDGDSFEGSYSDGKFIELMLSCENVEDSPSKEEPLASTSGIPWNKKPRYDKD